MVPVESLGLRKSNSGYQRDEAYSLDTVVHEITHQLMADAIPYLPIAVTEGMAEYTSHIPLRLGAFKPDSVLEMIRKDSERKPPLDFEALLRMTASQWSGTGPPKQGPSTPQMPVDPHSKHGQYRASLLYAYHLMHGLDNGKPDRMRELIFRAHAKAIERREQIEKYEKDYATYESAIKEFLKLPGVTDTGDGGFTYPSDLTPPEAPAVPFPEETEEQRQLGDMEIIYAGETPEEFIKEMKDHLQSLKIHTSP